MLGFSQPSDLNFRTLQHDMMACMLAAMARTAAAGLARLLEAGGPAAALLLLQCYNVSVLKSELRVGYGWTLSKLCSGV